MSLTLNQKLNSISTTTDKLQLNAQLVFNNSGAIVGTSVTVTSANATGGEYSGNYIKVSHFNHGMYSNTNKVILSDIESTVSPTTLSASLNNTETTNINVTSVRTDCVASN